MVSEKVPDDVHPMMRTLLLTQIAIAYKMRLNGQLVPIWKNILITPRDTYVVAMESHMDLGYVRASREFDDYEQAKGLYDYITSEKKFKQASEFARWKVAATANITAKGGAASMNEMIME